MFMKFKGQVDLMGISTPPGIPPRRHDGANLGVIEHASTCTKLQVVGDSDIGHNRGKKCRDASTSHKPTPSWQ